MNVNWNLLGRYLSGECSAGEEARVEAWIREEFEREAIMEDLRQVWETTGRPSSQWSQRDVQDLWARLQQHVREDARRKPRQFAFDRSSVPRRARGSLFGRRSHWAGAVVAVAVLALFAVLLWNASPREDTAPKVVVTQSGERAILRLADGTRVRLNVDSRLTYSPVFGKGIREVHLQGEAFFEVAPDAERPFVVRTEKTVVRVLGTAFGVQAYTEAGDEEAHVVVSEGRVAVRAPQSEDAVVVRPGDVVTLKGPRMHVQHVQNLDRYLAWTEGRLVFEDTPFDEVVEQLERWYSLDIEVAVPFDAVVALNATFDDEPLQEVLSNIAVALNLEYERDGRDVIFYRRTETLTSYLPAQNAFPAK